MEIDAKPASYQYKFIHKGKWSKWIDCNKDVFDKKSTHDDYQTRRLFAEEDVTKIIKSLSGSMVNEQYRLHAVNYPENSEFEQQENESFEEYFKRTDKLLEDLRETSSNLPEGQIVGGLIHFPVADGAAMYKVVKESPLILEHIPYGDSYHAPAVLLNGIDTDYIKDTLKKEKSISKIFQPQRPG